MLPFFPLFHRTMGFVFCGGGPFPPFLFPRSFHSTSDCPRRLAARPFFPFFFLPDASFSFFLFWFFFFTRSPILFVAPGRRAGRSSSFFPLGRSAAQVPRGPRSLANGIKHPPPLFFFSFFPRGKVARCRGGPRSPGERPIERTFFFLFFPFEDSPETLSKFYDAIRGYRSFLDLSFDPLRFSFSPSFPKPRN